LYKHDLQWAFGCFFAFLLAMSPLFVKKSYHISLPWIMELLIVVALSIHVWGGVLHLYSAPYYDKIVHFSVSAIIAFFALTVVYLLDVYWEGLHMDTFMVGFFIVIFTMAMGTIWELGEFASDQIFSGGIPVAQISLYDTMTDLIADTIAGIIVGVLGTMGIRSKEFKEMIYPLDKEAKKIGYRSFLRSKERAMDALRKAIENGAVDEKALPVIEKLNSIDEFFSTNSCSRRIVVIEVPSIGKKVDARFLGKWGGKVTVDGIMNTIKNANIGEIWILAQPPIFHVSVANMKKASELLGVAKQSGFKDSGIKHMGKRVMIEIKSTEEMDVPIGIDGKVMCSNEYLPLIVSIANEVMDRAEKKLEGLAGNIDKRFGL
jgi:tRNA wybutosine-synthesizing protein 3